MTDKACMDDYLCLAVRDLPTQRYWTGTLRWILRDEVTSEVAVECTPESCVFSYSQNGVPNNQTIYFSETPCNFGGNRKWFLCNRCHNRVSKLRFYGRSLVCGRCIGVGYKSQRLNKARRLQNRAKKIKEELGMETPASLCRLVEESDRPKGMHRSTFSARRLKANFFISKAINLWKI